MSTKAVTKQRTGVESVKMRKTRSSDKKRTIKNKGAGDETCSVPKRQKTSKTQGNDKQTKTVQSKYFSVGGKTVPSSSSSTSSSSSVSTSTSRLAKEFFQKSCIDLSKALLGQILVRSSDTGERLAAKIVEVEAYLGGEDKGAHSYGGKKTEKNAAMFMDPGTVYVYYIYGLYSCINISSQGEGAAVLIRALEPVDGIDKMREIRSRKKKAGSKPLKDHELCNGPSKLCQAMIIDKPTYNKKDITTCDTLWLEEGEAVDEDTIVKCPRIGIDYAKEWASKPLRFYTLGCQSVSVRNKEAEKSLQGDE
ncbi:uncharacterized protein LOC144435337 [Glandiceps talaboti]